MIAERPVAVRGLHALAAFLRAQPRHRAIVVSAVGLLFGVVVLVNLAALLSPPRLSLTLEVPRAGRARIGWVLPGGKLWDRGVRAGDAVLALDGRIPGRRDAGTWSGQRLLVRAATGRPLALGAASIGRVAQTWPLLLLSPWFLLLGTLLYLRARPPTVARAAYALFASAAFALALAPATDADVPLATFGEHVATPIFAACFALFFCTFPTLRGSPRLRGILLLPPFAVGALAAVEIVLPGLYPVGSALRTLTLLIYALLGAALSAYSFATTRDAVARRGLSTIGGCTALSLAPFAALYLVPTLLGRPPLLSAEQAVLGLALLPAGFGYTILRHQVLRVSLLQRWLVHALLWYALLAGCGVAAYALGDLAVAGAGQAARDPALVAGALILAAGCSRLPYDRLRRRLDEVLFQDSYDYRASLAAMSKELTLAGDLEALAGTLPDRLCRLMHLEFAVLLAGDGGAADGVAPPVLLPALAAAAEGVREGPQLVEVAAGCMVLLMPLHTQDVLVGHLCLGPKVGGEPFRAEDRALLATLSGQVAAIVRNVGLMAELRGQVVELDRLNERLERAQEEERALLAADLHDEALQTALHLHRRIAADGQGRATTAQHLAIASEVVRQLRAVCQRVRPAILDELGLSAALEVLVRELGARSGIPILLDVDPALSELPLCRDAELVLYRAAQEAVNNALRHASAGHLEITVGCGPYGVRLDVADDGTGFAVPARLDGLATMGHLGLAGLRQRVQRSGGRLAIASAPGRGTSVEVTLPVTGSGQ